MSESEAGKLGAAKTNLIQAQKKQERINLYNQNPKLCKQCSNILPYDKRYNTFCNKSCATIYNNKHNKDYKKQVDTLLNTIVIKNHDLYKDNSNYILDNHITTDGSIIQLYKRKNAKSCTKRSCKQCGCYPCICPDICKKFHIFNSLVKFGFDKSVVGTLKIKYEYNRVRTIIEQFYINHNSNDKLLKETFGYTSGPANFQKLLKSLNIKSKTQSEAQCDSLLNGNTIPNNSNIYHEEWHKTWDGKDVFLRSSYELDYANYLDEQKVAYEVESLRIKYYDSIQEKYRCAIPDFYLPDTNEIIEIKSFWTIKGRVQEMKDKFSEYINLGYIPKLILEHEEINVFNITEEYISECKKQNKFLHL